MPDRTPPIRSLLNAVDALSRAWRQWLASSNRGIPSAESKVLHLLHEHAPQSVPQIGRVCNTSRQNIQIVINRLVQEGAVECLPNPAHKRSPLFGLTDLGRTAFGTAHTTEAAMFDRLADVAPQAQVEVATRLLSSLCATLRETPLPDSRRPATSRLPRPTPSNPAQDQPEDIPVSLL